MNAEAMRVMRVTLPVRLIREMDNLIVEGTGGFATRSEFIVDAVQERILELTVESIHDDGPMPMPQKPEPEAPSSRVSESVPQPSPRMTALRPPFDFYVVPEGDNLSQPEGQPLFGLHNRDYPSLWVLCELAKVTTDGPVSIHQFYKHAISEAWLFGELLLAIEKHRGLKCTALFPTNSAKRKPAEAAFKTFAIGSYTAVDGLFRTAGPLFEWNALGLVAGQEEDPEIGITKVGSRILQAAANLSVEQPHSDKAARAFLGILEEEAPGDWTVFTEVIEAVGSAGASRQEVLEQISRLRPNWSTNEVSTNTAGYISRAREWGLVEPKQAKSKYKLAPLGLEYLN